MQIRPLDDADKGYCLASMRESHKQSPGCDNVPWSFYKHEWGTMFAKVLNDPSTVLLGAYDAGSLVGYLMMTPGKRVHTLHWVQVKHELDGRKLRRHGVMTALLEAANLGSRFLYTLHARRDRRALPDGTMTKSFDETLTAALRARGVTPVFTKMKEWLK